MPRAVVAERLAFVERTFAQTKSLAATAKAAKAVYGLSYSSCQRYLRRVKAVWMRAAANVDHAALREEHRAGIVADMALAREQGKLSVVATLWNLVCEIDQVKAPRESEVTIRRSPYDGMTDEQVARVQATGLLPGEPGFDADAPGEPKLN